MAQGEVLLILNLMWHDILLKDAKDAEVDRENINGFVSLALLDLATVGGVTQIGSFLFVLLWPIWPIQVRQVVSWRQTADGFTNKLHKLRPIKLT
jgi:hypothetical protein